MYYRKHTSQENPDKAAHGFGAAVAATADHLVAGSGASAEVAQAVGALLVAGNPFVD